MGGCVVQQRLHQSTNEFDARQSKKRFSLVRQATDLAIPELASMFDMTTWKTLSACNGKNGLDPGPQNH